MIIVVRFGSVSVSFIHEARASIDFSKVITCAGSSHLVTCVEVSPGFPQLGHLSARSLTQCDLAEVQPHMPETFLLPSCGIVKGMTSLLV